MESAHGVAGCSQPGRQITLTIISATNNGKRMRNVVDPARQMDRTRQTIISWAQQGGEARLMGDTDWSEKSDEMVAKYCAALSSFKAQHGDLGSLGYIDEHFGLSK